jgi:hypothetical protein
MRIEMAAIRSPAPPRSTAVGTVRGFGVTGAGPGSAAAKSAVLANRSFGAAAIARAMAASTSGGTVGRSRDSEVTCRACPGAAPVNGGRPASIS